MVCVPLLTYCSLLVAQRDGEIQVGVNRMEKDQGNDSIRSRLIMGIWWIHLEY